MSRVVKFNGMLMLSGVTASNRQGDIREQTREVLEKIENYLTTNGTSKDRLLTAQIWLKDIKRDFAGMNEVWDTWNPAGQTPTRATGQSLLAHEDLLVEIIATAAL
jgi:enamine deaminase RidA (YjgF/YER057c/UK114 family)